MWWIVVGVMAAWVLLAAVVGVCFGLAIATADREDSSRSTSFLDVRRSQVPGSHAENA